MYIWTAISFDDQLAALREQAARISGELGLDDPSLTLPIHTSLTISFEAADGVCDQIITDLAGYFSALARFPVHPKAIERNGSIIWLKMEESPELAGIHTHLIDLLQNRYGVQPHPFDLEFQFHATLFFGGDEQALSTALSRIKAAPLPEVLTARKFVIGTSPSGAPGSYCVCREIEL